MTVDNRFHAQSMIEELRYWAPSVNDVARVIEIAEGDEWRLFVVPNERDAAGVELNLRKDGLFDLEIAGDAMAGLAMTSRDMLAQLLDRIADGEIVQHHWVSRITGREVGLETVVRMKDGSLWQPRVLAFADETVECRTRHFLPFRGCEAHGLL